jgi:hypothetical protein
MGGGLGFGVLTGIGCFGGDEARGDWWSVAGSRAPVAEEWVRLDHAARATELVLAGMDGLVSLSLYCRPGSWVLGLQRFQGTHGPANHQPALRREKNISLNAYFFHIYLCSID